ncbi:MAG: tagaturonate epimerase family protein [Armatimonadota bacterium]
MESLHIYKESTRELPGGGTLCIARKGGKFIGISGSGLDLGEPSFREGTKTFHQLTLENYLKLRELLPISPTRCKKQSSFGTGDRLGLVSAAHLSALGKYPIFPVIAQQSPRELERTGRSFKSVLLDAVMGVLESGYAGAFGADADHVKDEASLRAGAEAGYSMYTLDVSDWLQDPAPRALSEESKKVVSSLEDKSVGGYTFSSGKLTESALVYEKSMEQVCRFREIIRGYLTDFDLEISIDEGARGTTPEDHAYVAEYLHKSGVDFTSLAPKFPGEFQKGVDFIGDMTALADSVAVHSAICGTLGGYRLSLHSGSDKFSVYPLFAGGNFHVKTSGTSWLEAVKVIASERPEVFADLYKLCLDNLEESKKAYHVYITPEHFPTEPTAETGLLEDRDVRQLFHISYGVLLDNRREQLFEMLTGCEETHYSFVRKHIERHLELLF